MTICNDNNHDQIFCNCHLEAGYIEKHACNMSHYWHNDKEENMSEELDKVNLADYVYSVLGCGEGVTRDFIRITLEDISLFDRKQHDRGPSNIAAFGEKGILIRLFDKLARLKVIVWEGKEPKVSEPVENEWADTSVYGVIARLVRRGLWR